MFACPNKNVRQTFGERHFVSWEPISEKGLVWFDSFYVITCQYDNGYSILSTLRLDAWLYRIRALIA